MKRLNLGPLSKGGRGTHAPIKTTRFETPQRVAPGTTQGNYVPATWQVRAGADDHLKHKSRGF